MHARMAVRPSSTAPRPSNVAPAEAQEAGGTGMLDTERSTRLAPAESQLQWLEGLSRSNKQSILLAAPQC